VDRLIILLTTAIGGLLTSPPVFVVLLLNLVPAGGVLWLGWSPLALLLLYWIENVVVGAANVAKMAAAARGKPNGAALAAGVIPFFLMHYGMFCLVHLVFTVLVGGGVFGGADPADVFRSAWATRLDFAWAVVAIAALHALDLFLWMREEAWRYTDPQSQMAAPYGRVVVLHVTILGGAFLLAETGAPASAILLLAVLKTIYEVLSTARRERKIRDAAEAQGRR